MNPVPISISMGATTYKFFTRDFKPPSLTRDQDKDIIHNATGKYKYIYDNGPGFRQFPPFTIVCNDLFEAFCGGGADTQYSNLLALWAYTSNLVLVAPEGTYNIHWAGDTVDQAFRAYPKKVNDDLEYEVVVQFEEA